MSLKNWARGVSPLFVLLLAMGCQGGGSTPAASATPDKAVLITTGQGSTAVLVPGPGGTGVERLAADKEPACKQCEADAQTYFQTGVISPKCPVCGATRTGLHSIN